MRILPLALLALTACAPSAMVGDFSVKRMDAMMSADFTRHYQCDKATVLREAERIKQEHPGTTWVPQRGMTACDVLARNGYPADVREEQGAAGRSANWFYRSYGTTGLVSLRSTGKAWVVDYVNW